MYADLKREAGTVGAKPEEPEEQMLKAWSRYRGPVNDDAAAFEAGFQAGLEAQSLPSPAPQVSREGKLESVLRQILQVGGEDFADTSMACYCGSVMGDEGDLDESAKCLVCLGWEALAQPVGSAEKEQK